MQINLSGFITKYFHFIMILVCSMPVIGFLLIKPKQYYYTCPYCDKIFNDLKLYQQHIGREHY